MPFRRLQRHWTVITKLLGSWRPNPSARARFPTERHV